MPIIKNSPHVPGNKLFLSIQSITHRSADFTTRGHHRRKSDVVLSGTNNKKVDGTQFEIVKRMTEPILLAKANQSSPDRDNNPMSRQ